MSHFTIGEDDIVVIGAGCKVSERAAPALMIDPRLAVFGDIGPLLLGLRFLALEATPPPYWSTPETWTWHKSLAMPRGALPSPMRAAVTTRPPDQGTGISAVTGGVRDETAGSAISKPASSENAAASALYGGIARNHACRVNSCMRASMSSPVSSTWSI